MKLCSVIFVWLLSFFYSEVRAQEAEDVTETYEPIPFNFGIGAGLDYGGIGARITLFPISTFSLFGGLGYNFQREGFNVGALLRITPDAKVGPYLIGMYGYNSMLAIKYSGGSSRKETYYGTSFGLGIEARSQNMENFFSLAILVPVRSAEFNDDYDRWKSQGVKFSPEPLPVLISIGYHFRM